MWGNQFCPIYSRTLYDWMLWFGFVKRNYCQLKLFLNYRFVNRCNSTNCNFVLHFFWRLEIVEHLATALALIIDLFGHRPSQQPRTIVTKTCHLSFDRHRRMTRNKKNLSTIVTFCHFLAVSKRDGVFAAELFNDFQRQQLAWGFRRCHLWRKSLLIDNYRG